GDAWSRIKPEAFFGQLTRSNERCGGKLVPTIKFIKVVNQTFPETVRLTGYHIESLAIEAFRNYKGALNTKAMLKHFFEDSTNRVLKPITDRTGQSVYVDEYLGAANSQKRRLVSDALDRILRQMKNADASRSREQWLRIVGEE
ncbi:MAG: CBASS oligonucleotide cyclase, partial [Candidatus Binatia bacterium]